MTTNKKVFTALFFMFLFAGIIFAQSLRLLESESFDVSEKQTLKVKAPVADVIIETWDKNEVEIKVYGNKKAKKELDIIIDKYSRGVKVQIKKEGFNLFNLFNNVKAKIEAKIPRNFVLDISTSGGDIAAYNVNGDIYLDTSGGDIILEESTGELKAGTSGGSIKLRDHTGESNVSTSGGDIEVINHEGDINAETSGGDIDLDVKNGEIHGDTSGGNIHCIYKGQNKGIDLSTSGGNVKVKVPSKIRARVHLYTSGGNCSLDFDNAALSKDKDHEIKGKLNGGGPKISCSTSGGNVRLSEI